MMKAGIEHCIESDQNSMLSLLLAVSEKGCTSYSPVINSYKTTVHNSAPQAARSKPKANFCICIQPPTLSGERLNFKKHSFSYFF